MTKEEILKSKLPQALRYGWLGSNPVIEWEKALDAMQEYADSEVKKFHKPVFSGQLEAIRTDFCLWYYAQSQPLDAHKVVDWFASNFC